MSSETITTQVEQAVEPETIACGNCDAQLTDGELIRQDGMCFCPKKNCGERICARCGCTYYSPCDEGCGWSKQNPEVCDSHGRDSLL